MNKQILERNIWFYHKCSVYMILSFLSLVSFMVMSCKYARTIICGL